MEKGKKFRVLMGKMGLDAHDNGVKIVSRWLMDAGYEVIYAGLYNTTKRIIKTALEENVDLIGLGFMDGEHLYFVPQILSALKTEEIESIKVILGGVIPPDHVAQLKDMGVHAVFSPGTTKDEILTIMNTLKRN